MKVQIDRESWETYQLTTHNGVSVELDDNTIEEIELAFDLCVMLTIRRWRQ